MNASIKNALIVFIEEKDIVSSWGITNISVNDYTIAFNVNGFIYSGSIVIFCNTSCYKIVFSDGKTIECSINELVSVLDTNIEYSQDYEKKLRKWIDSLL